MVKGDPVYEDTPLAGAMVEAWEDELVRITAPTYGLDIDTARKADDFIESLSIARIVAFGPKDTT